MENRRVQGDFISDFQYIKGAYEKHGEGLLQGHVKGTRGNGLKLKKVHLYQM